MLFLEQGLRKQPHLQLPDTGHRHQLVVKEKILRRRPRCGQTGTMLRPFAFVAENLDLVRAELHPTARSDMPSIEMIMLDSWPPPVSSVFQLYQRLRGAQSVPESDPRNGMMRVLLGIDYM